MVHSRRNSLVNVSNDPRGIHAGGRVTASTASWLHVLLTLWAYAESHEITMVMIAQKDGR